MAPNFDQSRHCPSSAWIPAQSPKATLEQLGSRFEQLTALLCPELEEALPPPGVTPALEMAPAPPMLKDCVPATPPVVEFMLTASPPPHPPIQAAQDTTQSGRLLSIPYPYHQPQRRIAPSSNAASQAERTPTPNAAKHDDLSPVSNSRRAVCLDYRAAWLAVTGF